MKEWKVVTRTDMATVTRTYIVTSEDEPRGVEDLSGALLLETDSDDYDNEEVETVEPEAE